MQSFLLKLKAYLKTFPKKHNVEYISALLSIPVLLTVIFLNFSNIQGGNKNDEPTPTITQVVQPQTTLQPTANPEICKKEIGPISISSPTEGETVTENPINFTISYTDNSYCSVVWSYRINGGNWSAYTSNNPSLYNPPNGPVKFELRIQSTVLQASQTLTRNFPYRGTEIVPTPTSSPTPTPTTITTPTPTGIQ